MADKLVTLSEIEQCMERVKNWQDDIKPKSWNDVQKLVRLGLASRVFSIGDQLVCQRNGENLVWDIIGIDHDTPTDTKLTHSLTLQLHDCLPTTMQYDAREALYYAETELEAGTYHFTIQSGYDETYGGGKTYQFTLTKPVPAGGQITFGWSYNTQASAAKINTYENGSSTAAIETVSVSEGIEGTNLGTTDGKSENLNHIHRVRYGSNNPLQNALRQFLNSDKSAGQVWTPQTDFDRPPTWASNTAGFMNGMDDDFLAVVGKTHKVTCLNTVTDGGGSTTQDDMFFFLSRSEVYAGNESNSVNEGEPYPYYSENSDLQSAGTGNDTNRIKYRNGNTASWWWLRSPVVGSGSGVRNVSVAGGLSYTSAGNSYGVAPACNII